MLLAIDTSTAIASIALFGQVAGGDQPGVLAEHTWRAGQHHTTQLLPQVERLLADAGIAPPDLTAIGVALGPGSFNGIRVGMATAKLLATSLDLPLVGASTLEATAFAQREAVALATLAAGRPAYIRPLEDAGRGQIATALYRSSPSEGSLDLGDLVELEPPRIADLADLLAALGSTETAAGGWSESGDGPVLVCGEVRAEWAAELALRGSSRIVLASASGSLRRAGALAELAWRRLQLGRVDDPATLQAIYLRRPPVLERVSLPELG